MLTEGIGILKERDYGQMEISRVIYMNGFSYGGRPEHFLSFAEFDRLGRPKWLRVDLKVNYSPLDQADSFSYQHMDGMRFSRVEGGNCNPGDL